MLKFFAYIIALCGIAYSATAEEMSLEDTIAEVNDSVVGIIADNGDNQALGAGIIVSEDGYVVTNAHVAEDANSMSVVTTQDDVYSAKLVGIDAKTDIALLKVENPQDFKPAQFADSDLVRTGNSVFAIGNPFGLGNSVSLGIISAKERDIEKGPYDNFLQTDAAINQGNSGGPLFNTDGEVVGMNTVIFSTNGNNMGVGFSTPSNIVQWVVKELKTNGKVIRGWMGIGLKKIKMENDAVKSRLAVVSMSENSPAEEAGLKVGDILLAAGDLELGNPRIFSLQISKIKPGTELPIVVLRDGEEQKLSVKVVALPQPKKENKKENNTDAYESSYSHKFSTEFMQLGMSLSYDEENQEVLIDEVEEQSDAAIKGLQAGDKFKIMDGHKIFSMEDLKVKLKEAQPRGQVVLQFVSDDGVDTVTLKLKEQK